MLDQLGRKNQVDEKMDLSWSQIEAVEHKSGLLLVAAGAGSGKTRTHRVSKREQYGG